MASPGVLCKGYENRTPFQIICPEVTGISRPRPERSFDRETFCRAGHVSMVLWAYPCSFMTMVGCALAT